MNEKKGMDSRSVSLFEVLILLKQKIIFLLAACVLFGAAGFAVSAFLIKPTYEANATMIVNTRVDTSSAVTNDQITSAENLVDTYSVIIRSRTVLNEVIQNLGLDMSMESLQKRVGVSSVNGTQVMEITVEMKDPAQARAILEELLKVAPGIIIDTVEAGSVKILEAAECPEKPVSPNIKLNTFLAAVVGLILAAALCVFRFMLHNTYSTSKELEEDLGVAVLGMIPALDSCEKMTGEAG